MTPALITPPAAEPLSLAETKEWLRLDGSAEDATVAALILAARQSVERFAGRKLLAQGWRILADAWPTGGSVGLPLATVSAVTAIRVIDAFGVAQTIAPALYRLEAQRDPPRLVLNGPMPDPGRASSGIEIDVTCGYGAIPSDVPEPLRQAMRLLVARWFENRGDGATDAALLPADVALLLAPFRRPRI